VTRRTILSTLLVLVAACSVEEQSRGETSNPEIKIDFLFEHEGCRVYRFYDSGRPVYLARCGGAAASTAYSYRVSCGKGCVKLIYRRTLALTGGRP
jgi:hypothetical protein